MEIDFMGQSAKMKTLVWTTPKLDLPVRTQNGKGQVIELRDIEEGKQDDQLFEVPEGYQKTDNLMQGMGNIINQALQGSGSDEKQADQSSPFKLPKGMKLPFQIKKK